MATSEVDICKRAMLRVGATKGIETLDDDSQEGRLCKLLYAETRDRILEAFPWPWAAEEAVLALVANFTPLRYGYAYSLPTDCLMVREVFSVTRPRSEERTPYDFQTYNGAKVLVTDDSAAKIIYTAQITNPLRFPSNFTRALEWGVALELAMALPGRLDMMEACRRQYAAALHAAASIGLSEQQQQVEPDSDLVNGGI